MDASGRPYFEFVHTIDITPEGARLGGVRSPVAPGTTVALQYEGRRGRFNVVWARPVEGTAELEVGLHTLECDTGFWTPPAVSESAAESAAEEKKDEPASTVNAGDRRRNQRYEIDATAEVRLAGSAHGTWVKVGDVSNGGCYCWTINPLAVAVPVEVTLRINGLDVLAAGIVRTCHPGSGMGIEFTQFETPAHEASMARELAGLDPLPELSGTSQRKPDARQMGAHLERTTAQLQDIGELLKCTDVDARVLRDFRQALSQVRKTAWAVQRWLELDVNEDDPYRVLKYLNSERIQAATEICRALTRDFATLNPETLEGEFALLRQAVEELFREIARKRNAQAAGKG
jgi:hypothetical protein